MYKYIYFGISSGSLTNFYFEDASKLYEGDFRLCLLVVCVCVVFLCVSVLQSHLSENVVQVNE